MTDAARYEWVEKDDRLMAACFTVVTRSDEEEVARGFGGILSSERRSTFDAAFNDFPKTMHLVFDRMGNAVIIAENNGWEGSRPEVAEAVSRECRYASVYWSVNADMTFVYASGGNIVAWFDPLLIEQPWAGSDPDTVKEAARDLPFGVEAPRAASLALAERLTGVSLQQAVTCTHVTASLTRDSQHVPPRRSRVRAAGAEPARARLPILQAQPRTWCQTHLRARRPAQT